MQLSKRVGGSLLFFLVATCGAAESTMPPGTIYQKPFVKKFGSGTFLGGYMDLQFQNSNGSGSDTTSFDQERFVPFIYGEVHPRVHVAAEIEFEHGGFVTGDSTEDTDGEIKIEFATIDFTAYEWLNFRAGVILSPLGRFNLNHDSPVNDLTERPLVDRFIIPTTLSEAGAGFFGAVYPTEESVLNYEIYAVNGFNEETVASGSTELREGRGSAGRDNNRDKSMVSRVSYSPFLGLDMGGSVHTGAYDDNGDNWLTIAAADVAFSRGSFDFLGEYARAWVEGNVDQHGSYAQTAYRFLHGVFSSLPNSYFVGVFRYDWIDLSKGQSGNHRDRFTLGLNFRPIQETVFKLDYAFLGSTDPGSSNRQDDGGLLSFSVATYF